MRLAPLALTAALGLAVALPLTAQQDPGDAAIKARQAHMTLYQANAGVLFGMAQGRVEYDAQAAQAAADNLVALSGLDQGLYWLPGTAVGEAMVETRALPALWENSEEAMATGMALHEAAMAMAAVASDGLEAVQGALGPIGGACSSCHEKFRQSNN